MVHAPRILVVDDELLSRDVLVRRLAANGITAEALADAEGCLAALDAGIPDLVLLDVSMPGMSGLELLRRVRRKWTKQQLPVILVTALVDSDDVVEGLAAGANDYVVKPVTMPVLIARMDVCLEMGRAVRERDEFEAALKKANESLEQRVAQRTAELAQANEKLRGEILERSRIEAQLIVYRDQLRTLGSQLAVAEERERKRIADGLHDELGQILALVRMKLGMADVSSKELAANLDQAIRVTRSLTFDLGSRMVYEFGLEAALENLADQLRKDNHIEVIFEDDEQPKPLDERSQIVVYRAARELLHNITKHAKASSVEISIWRENDKACLLVSDNGIGFEVPAGGFRCTLEGGYGLFNVREQLSYVNGTMSVESRPGQGTRVTLAVPVEKQANRHDAPAASSAGLPSEN